MKLIDNLKWRYATKKFDASKKASPADIAYIKEVVQLAATSYGLQPFKVLDIKNPKLRENLKPHCWNQTQITDASHLFVFCNMLNVTDKDVDDALQIKADNNNIPTEKLAGYSDFVKGKLKEKSEVEMFHWTAKQAYIALGKALSACAELQLDSTPMEGFESDAVNKKLGLHEQGFNACVLLAVGYRHAEDVAQNGKKARKSIGAVFEEL